MARLYAGILALIALIATLLLGLFQGQSADAILLAAWFHLWIFAAVGYLFGTIAGHLVDEAVRKSIAGEDASDAPPPEATDVANAETAA